MCHLSPGSSLLILSQAESWCQFYSDLAISVETAKCPAHGGHAAAVPAKLWGNTEDPEQLPASISSTLMLEAEKINDSGLLTAQGSLLQLSGV